MTDRALPRIPREQPHARVLRSLLLFDPQLDSLRSATRSTMFDLDVARGRDELRRFGLAVAPEIAGFGPAVFATFAAMAAHAPSQLRKLFEGPVHVGPATFDGGGMGAGFGARWL